MLAIAFWDSRALVTAMELDIFTVLDEQPATLSQLCQRIGLVELPARSLLNGLVALGVLERDGDLYRNGVAAGKHLVAGRPGYLGGLTAMVNWQSTLWAQLRKLLETGESQTQHGTEFDMYADPNVLRRFMEYQETLSAGLGAMLAEAIDWSRHELVIDLGGARGNVLADVLAANPHLRAGVFDLPPVEPLFTEHVTRLGLADRITFAPGDFFADDLPSADAFVYGHVLHDWDEPRRQQLVDRAAEALRPGGALLVYDCMIDSSRPETGRNWLLSLTMQLATPGGSEYPAEDCVKWMENAGLVDIRILPLINVESVVVGYKPA
jgi:SAM-dependent methyltransferase